MSDCLFCSIASGAAPGFMVATTPTAAAFLDVRPVFKGHVLVVPKTHVVTLGDLDPAEIPEYFGFVQRIARAVETGLSAGGTFVAINNRVSQSVPHLHTHVVPRTKGDGLKGFFWPRTKYESDEEALSFAEKISTVMSS
ncbi:HIT family protein [Dactylosporangium darangshiense]|uniref:HIT family protein n=1 Tax=Dactylosporangium darangshiense TaxID=579108 RepID=A0ABP8D680_9ACTN